MRNWSQLLRKNTGLSPYVWVVFYILPFYFIINSTSTLKLVLGIGMIIAFFVCYVLSFVSKGWLVYFWTSIQIAISIFMSLVYAYVYFSLFLAFFIGNLKNRYAFFTLYVIHLLSTFATINYGFATQNQVFITQLPFVFLSLIAVILLPVSTYNKNKEERLQGQLEHANKRISDLVKLEERQRIARDLHDTLGQKLSLIGLKSDLAGKLLAKNPRRALNEIRDIQQTARTALKEVRELVTEMRGTRLEDELQRAKQMLAAAQIELEWSGDVRPANTSPITENVLGMCLKEAVTNVVKHSDAKRCIVTLTQSPTEIVMTIRDDGVGLTEPEGGFRGHGLKGMRERLEFVNGSLEFGKGTPGATLVITVPKTHKQPEVEAGV